MIFCQPTKTLHLSTSVWWTQTRSGLNCEVISGTSRYCPKSLDLVMTTHWLTREDFLSAETKWFPVFLWLVSLSDFFLPFMFSPYPPKESYSQDKLTMQLQAQRQRLFKISGIIFPQIHILPGFNLWLGEGVVTSKPRRNSNGADIKAFSMALCHLGCFCKSSVTHLDENQLTWTVSVKVLSKPLSFLCWHFVDI